MAKINATNIRLYIPTEDVDNDDANTTWEPAAMAEESTLTINVAGIDVTNKDSSGWAEEIDGVRSWNVSYSGITDFTQTLAGGNPNVKAFFDYVNSRSEIIIAWGQDGYHFYGSARVRTLTMGGAKEDKSTYSVTLNGTGALSVTWDGAEDVDAASAYPNA